MTQMTEHNKLMKHFFTTNTPVVLFYNPIPLISLDFY